MDSSVTRGHISQTGSRTVEAEGKRTVEADRKRTVEADRKRTGIYPEVHTQVEADRKRTGIYPEVHRLKLIGKEQEFTQRCTS
jgi:hypothetical protein